MGLRNRVLVVDACTCRDPSCPRWKGMVRDVRGVWRWPSPDEERAAREGRLVNA